MDEAGYGPNLGPLVQAAVVVRAPDRRCGWTRLRSIVRRGTEPDDGRLAVDDSKVVHAGPGGFSRLELSVLSAAGVTAPRLGDWLNQIGLGPTVADLQSEPWYDPSEPQPVAADGVDQCRQRFIDACRDANLTVFGVHAVVTPATRLNAIVARFDSKAVALAEGLIELLRNTVVAGRADEVFVDKQGGRNFYAPLLQSAFGDRWVAPVSESAGWSEYRVGDTRIAFAPKAEGRSFAVALASMVAKYLRERFMRQFNRYWAGHVPGLRPTAGYPTDARRYYDAIRPAMASLGIPGETVWRCR
jgi:ribonuclease HII